MELLFVGDDKEMIKLTAGLAEEIWRQHFSGIISRAQIEYMLEHFQSYDAMVKQILNESYKYYLIKDDNGSYEGYFAIAPRENDLFLSKIYIRKRSRGKGYASQSIKFIKDYAKKMNLGSVTLTVNRENTDTVNIYKKMKFEIVSEADKDIGNGFFMNDYIMELKVGD